MQRHLVLISDFELKNIISGSQQYLVRFFKKRPDFLGQVGTGDLVYFRKKGDEALGQFVIGKLTVMEGADNSDWELLKNRFGFEKRLDMNNVILIVQITKLEQFIASPLEMPYNLRRDWLVLENN